MMDSEKIDNEEVEEEEEECCSPLAMLNWKVHHMPIDPEVRFPTKEERKKRHELMMWYAERMNRIIEGWKEEEKEGKGWWVMILKKEEE